MANRQFYIVILFGFLVVIISLAVLQKRDPVEFPTEDSDLQTNDILPATTISEYQVCYPNSTLQNCFFVWKDPKYEALESIELLWTPPIRSVNLRRGYTLWGTDCHMGPRAEFGSLFPKMGMKYLDRSWQVGFEIIPGTKDRPGPWNIDQWTKYQKDFFNHYKNSDEFKSVDAFMCSFDPHYCFLYLPFNKPIISVSAFRMDAHEAVGGDQIRVWQDITKQMDRHPDVILAATNPYDAMYINHFTGSRRVAELSAIGDYMPHRYNPDPSFPVVIGPQRLSGGGNQVAEQIQKLAASTNQEEKFPTIAQRYPGGYQYTDLVKHKAVIVLPYSIHSYGMLEMRRMGIPLFYPSASYLAIMERDYHMIAERKSFLGQASDGPLIPHERSLSGNTNPNNDFSLPDLEYWLQFSDFYQWPVIRFDNITHLFELVNTTDYAAAARKMVTYNDKMEKRLKKKWESVFYSAFDDGIEPGKRQIPETYEEGMRIWNEKSAKPNWSQPASNLATTGMNDKWIVITSINLPTDQVKILAALPGWKVVVVGDKKTPKDWEWDNCVFLSVEDQLKLGYRILKHLPYDHYTRKNVGYLYAIQHGAKTIYDVDDDNVITGETILYYPEETSELPIAQTDSHLVNPYAIFGKPQMWPRGFPLEEVRNPHVIPKMQEPISAKISIQQGLANHDPDVDAIHRLTNPLPVTFTDIKGAVIPKNTFTPFNSQNTVFHYGAFWGLLIPKTTTFRVCDIWRGYWAQRVLWETGGQLCFLNATAIQVRNPHNYLDDFEDETDLYLTAGHLVKYLKQWVPEKTEHVFDIIYTLHRDMASAGFWEKKEAELTKAWLLDLIDVGYLPPKSHR